MAAVRISCFLVLCVIFCVGAKIISGKAYYCRDPDTGKLHDVNTTWPSTTFCGSYICKLRKKSHTNFEVQPLRQLNLTSHNNRLVVTFNTSMNENLTETFPVDNFPSKHGSQRNISIDAKEIQELVRQKMRNLNEHTPPRQGDRYLTDAEIKAFTEVLHIMKKSDLEALMEIYSIARDIYKEMDKITDENIIEETLRDLKENNISDKVAKAMNKSTSYWYEPLAVISNKHRINDNDISKDSELMQNVLDNLTQGRNNEVANVKPKETMTKAQPIPTPKPNPNPSVFFKGTVSEDEFGKLPYFYPMSSFQRLSSYINPFPRNNIQSDPIAYRNDAQIPPIYQVIPPWYEPFMVPYPVKTQPDMTYNKQVAETKSVAQIQNVANLMQTKQKNLTETENSYFNAYPWSLYNLYPPIKKQVPQELPYVNTGYLSYIPNAVLINPEITEVKQDIEMNPIEKKTEKSIPDWQTEPLPNSVLDEVRANILMKSKLLPLRKKMRLERVGKVIKLEDRKDRTKREAVDFDEYEAYVEKYTCGSDTEPGFFRMGNITQPYPACCPQRIGKGS